MTVEEMVVLVDVQDNEIGIKEKLQAHLDGNLHRAISIFLFNDKQEMLLQQRAHSKYHSGGLWTNTCCSHPRPGEPIKAAAERRLMEEMGIRCELEKVFDFTYKAFLDKNLTEHEFDHVFVGKFDGEPNLNPEEACDWKWMGLVVLEWDVQEHPERYTAWFKIILKRVLETSFSLS